MSKKSFRATIGGRLTVVLLFFLAAECLLIGRLFILQVVEHKNYSALATKQQKIEKNIFPERGAIYLQDKDGALIPAALSQAHKTLAASPNLIIDRESTSLVLANELGVDKDEILKRISNPSEVYRVLARRVSLDKAEAVEKLRLRGIYFEEEKARVYPHSLLAAHVIGFASKENEMEAGRYGTERFYNKELSGEKGFFEGIRNAGGFWVALGRRIVNPPQNGFSVVLTIDYNIQRMAEEMLERTVKKWGAAGGAVLVVDPRTGRVLALSAYPSFNPNEFGKVRDFSVFLNPVVESMYEMGSVMKPVIMAAGIEERVVAADTTYHDPGEIRIGNTIIRNFDRNSHGTQTMTQVMEKSLNTGVVRVAQLVGKEKHLDYLKRFGFGERTGIDLPGEVSGNISNLNAFRDIDFATASFGQGIAMTPLQLAMAISALANNGILVQPYVVEKVLDGSGNEMAAKPQEKRRVVSQETAEVITKMLVSTVKNGFENKAGIKGYFVAGKTGTAQIPRTDGRGYSDKVMHSFVGYTPAFDPRFLILIQLNEPLGNRFAANTLTPAFHDLAEYILNYYEIPPDEK